MTTKRRFLFEKLIRDKMPEIWEKEGVVAKTETLSDNDMFLDAITQKMIEELQEVFSCESQEELIAELADFEEVYAEFKHLIGVSNEDILKARTEKNNLRGIFSKRIFCDYVDIPPTAKEHLEYVEKNTQRYPELDPATNEFLNGYSAELEEEYEEDEE